MSLWMIAWRSIQQRGLASALTTLSMALGVMMVVAVLSIHGVVAKSFRNNSSLGYNLIVGAKGGKLQLTLNTVYYLSTPVENIPYEYYLEFHNAEKRAAEYQNSLAVETHQMQWDAIQAATVASPGLAATGGLLAEQLAADADYNAARFERVGRWGQFIDVAIPVALGDYFGRFRAVGTTPDMFEKLKYGPAADTSYEFAQGRNFKHWSEEHGYYEAVLGSAVAREMRMKLGDTFSPSHGDPEGEGHAQQFTVVGILAPTGTPNDRAAFINLEGFYLMDDHSKDVEDEEEEQQGDAAPAEIRTKEEMIAAAEVRREREREHAGRPLPVEQREVSAVLLLTVSDVVGMRLDNVINEGNVAQCVAPIREIAGLFSMIVDPIQYGLLAITALICVVSGISILVSIYNSMSDRRQEIAVMRALGASRGTVMTVILLESILLSVGGGLLGWVGGHVLNVLASGEIEQRTGVTVGFFSFAPPLQGLELPLLGPIMGVVSPELLLIPALIALAVVVGIWPAAAAYKTDVAKSLGS